MIKIPVNLLTYIRNNYVAIHCETQKEFDDMLKFFEKQKATWADGSLPTACEYYWGRAGADTCLRLDGHILTHSPKDYYLKKGYTVLKFIEKKNGVYEANISMFR